ncbi:hypothetical protein AgCh_020070 [Apium graveolens]
MTLLSEQYNDVSKYDELRVKQYRQESVAGVSTGVVQSGGGKQHRRLNVLLPKNLQWPNESKLKEIKNELKEIKIYLRSGQDKSAKFSSRIHLRVCLKGGYRVLDESTMFVVERGVPASTNLYLAKLNTFMSPSNSSSSNFNFPHMSTIDNVSSVVSMMKDSLKRKQLNNQIERYGEDVSLGYYDAQKIMGIYGYTSANIEAEKNKHTPDLGDDEKMEALEKTIPKEKSEYTVEDISSIAKDARVRHLLHSAIDNVMSNRVIHCKTAKEIWDALETRCQGTDAIKKNRRTILTQEYEHFDSKADESLTDLYDRFVKLLNELSLVDKEYDLEDLNLKFLLTLPENWDLKSTTIRDNYDLTETTLDEIYGMLKTYELEMDQRSKRHGRKSRTVALKAEEESPKVAASKRGKGKALIIKSDSESSYSDDDDSETESLPEMDVDAEMMQLCALMVKGITKIAYRKFRKGKKFSKKCVSSDKKGFRKSKGKGGKSDRGDNSNVKCYNCGERCHISPDYKKGKRDKGKALVTKKKSWTDTSDSEDEGTMP